MNRAISAEGAAECRHVIERSVFRNAGDSLMLSGGLDTSIIASVVAEHARPKCFTTIFPLGETPDIPYARRIARRLGLDWEILELTPELLPQRLTGVIGVLETFDPMEVRNSLAVYHGLTAARDQGFSRSMTGDGVDELFAGYSFSFNLPPAELMKRLRDLWRVMHFSSTPMAESLGMSAFLPYLDTAVVKFAKTLGPAQLVGTRNGRRYGKLILRVAFEGLIGKKSAWRVKTPIEFGSGTTVLPNYYAAKVKDDAFGRGRREASREGVAIRDKEHMEYYRLYRSMFTPPSERAKTSLRCPSCGGDVVKRGSKFCVTCGAYPIVPVAVQ